MCSTALHPRLSARALLPRRTVCLFLTRLPENGRLARAKLRLVAGCEGVELLRHVETVAVAGHVHQLLLKHAFEGVCVFALR